MLKITGWFLVIWLHGFDAGREPVQLHVYTGDTAKERCELALEVWTGHSKLANGVCVPR